MAIMTTLRSVEVPVGPILNDVLGFMLKCSPDTPRDLHVINTAFDPVGDNVIAIVTSGQFEAVGMCVAQFTPVFDARVLNLLADLRDELVRKDLNGIAQ